MTDTKTQPKDHSTSLDPIPAQLIAESARQTDALSYLIRIAATLMDRDNAIRETIRSKATTQATAPDETARRIEHLTQLYKTTQGDVASCLLQIADNNRSVQDLIARIHVMEERSEYLVRVTDWLRKKPSNEDTDPNTAVSAT